MGLNTYPANPFPPSTDQMDADALETEVSKLKSGLTNVDVALSVPDGTGKNVIPMTLAAIKAANTVGTWSGNAYTANDVTFTVQADGDENVVGITANGTATQGTLFYLYKKGSDTSFPTNDYILTGCADGGSNSTWRIIGVEVEGGSNVYFGDSGSGATFNTTATKYLNQLYIEVFNGVNIGNKTFYPMIRLSSVSDPTFAPYIPSVESRIEAVEVVKHRRVAESATSGTYADKLNSLYTAYTALSDLEKQHSYIVFSANIVPLMDAHNIIFASALKYTSGSTAFNGYSAKLAETSSTMHKIVAGSTGNTISELSSTSNSDIFYLYV